MIGHYWLVIEVTAPTSSSTSTPSTTLAQHNAVCIDKN